MAEEVAAAIAYMIEGYGAETAAYEAVYYVAYAAIVIAEVAVIRSQQINAERKAKDAYNASLRDRYAMVRGSREPRALVFGRARVSGPIFFIQSRGTDRQYITFCVALAAHELDAIETIYLDDEPVTLDGSGNVTGIQRKDTFSISTATATFTVTSTPVTGSVSAVARYGSTNVTLTIVSVTGSSVSVSGALVGQTGLVDITYQPNPNPYYQISAWFPWSDRFTIVTGSDTFVLTYGLQMLGAGIQATIAETAPGAGDGGQNVTVSHSGANATISGAGAYVGRTVVISYQVAGTQSRMRIRKYLGAPGQTADSKMITDFPGIWTSAHTVSGVAYLVCECDYDSDAFSGGIPNVSAVVRGMKCYDPRSGTTVWTENPALHARALATHALGGRLPTAQVDDAAVTLAANVCDTVATYTVGTAVYTRALYTSSYVYKTDRRPVDGLVDLCQAMGGSWVFADGTLQIAAGAYRTPVLSLDESWLIGDQPVQVQPDRARADLVNTITATFVDQQQDYKPIAMPRLSPSAYVTIDGAVLPQDVTYAAVPFTGQAQYISACNLRAQRQGMVLKLSCNLRAWQAARFDVINVSIARFGFVSKPFEVVETSWTTDGAIELTLRETSSTIFDMDPVFSAIDPAPNTRLPSPWGLPFVAGLTATSGTTTLLVQGDGTVIPRIRVDWTAQSDGRVTNGGKIEIRYWQDGTSSSIFQTVFAAGADVQAYLTGVKEGQSYFIIARTVSAITASYWTNPIRHTVAGKTAAPGNVAGAAYTQGNGAVHLSWTANTEGDYKLTEARVGASWGAGALIGQIAGTKLDWPNPGFGTYTVWFAHQNWSGVYSGTPASLSVTVTSAITGTSISATLTSPSATLSANSAGHVSSYAGITTTISVFDGATDVTASWTFSKADSTGITSALSGANNNILTVSNMADATDSGYVDITASRTGYTSIVQRYVLAKSKSAVGSGSGVVLSLGGMDSNDTPGSGTATASMQLVNDGTVKTKNGGVISVSANWYSPTTAGAGTGRWVKVTKVSNTNNPTVTGTVGSWVDMSTSPSWSIARTTMGIYEQILLVQIAENSSGVPVVGSGYADLYAEHV